MSLTLLEMAKELITALILVHHLPPDEARALLMSTHATLLRLHWEEVSGAAAATPPTEGGDAPADWQRSITKHAIKLSPPT
ncbi:hypothetical protein [Candidatus Entotheonella palauensis]|uniref:Uncharacterized protein n=1 Tax=Candidatus Entotheonella gemina TaxID=1429439 RepID=W4LMG7_9BACT|nr:hypothetical protein [Candidatus Entotheonella palauensis]ETW99109.1 MAG: hypothetical protein ETSY2_41565 [Candidatus Entotheonella gemina]